MKKQIPQFVHVWWRDSKRHLYQMSEDDVDGVSVIHTASYLVLSAKDSITLAQDLIEGEWRGVMTIPRENIVEMNYLTIK